MSEGARDIRCDCVCHLRGHGCKEVVPLREENERLRERVEELKNVIRGLR